MWWNIHFKNFSQFSGTQSFLNCFSIWWDTVIFWATYSILSFYPSILHANTNKRAWWNSCAGGNLSSKSINVQNKIRSCRGDFSPKCACTSIQYTRVTVSCHKYPLFNCQKYCTPILVMKLRQIITWCKKFNLNKSATYIDLITSLKKSWLQTSTTLHCSFLQCIHTHR